MPKGVYDRSKKGGKAVKAPKAKVAKEAKAVAEASGEAKVAKRRGRPPKAKVEATITKGPSPRKSDVGIQGRFIAQSDLSFLTSELVKLSQLEQMGVKGLTPTIFGVVAKIAADFNNICEAEVEETETAEEAKPVKLSKANGKAEKTALPTPVQFLAEIPSNA